MRCSRSLRTLLGSLALVVAATSLSGCGPSLRYELRRERHFEATRPCGQGPFEIDVEPLRARLGERYELYVCSPHPVVGRFEVLADGDARLGEGPFSSRIVRHYDRELDRTIVDPNEVPANARCLAEPVAEPIVEAPTPPWPPPQPPEAWVPIDEPPPPAEEPPPVVMAATDLVEVRARDLPCPSVRLGRIDIWDREYRVAFSDAPSGAPSEHVRIVLWSEQPNDLEGVTFVLRQYAATSSDGDEAYLAYLRRKEEDDQRAANERARRERERAEHCANHPNDPFCWGLGGREAYVKKREQEADAEAKRREAARARREELARRRAEAEARWGTLDTPVVAAPACPQPSGPPPLAPNEITTPQPTPNAKWIPGHYAFACGEWVWSSGFWRVPDEDLMEERWLLTAPAPPPPPPVEAPSVTIHVDVGLVWVPGIWMYVDGKYVWVPGSYRMAPRPGAKWKAGEWRTEGGRVRFVPGRWE